MRCILSNSDVRYQEMLTAIKYGDKRITFMAKLGVNGTSIVPKSSVTNGKSLSSCRLVKNSLDADSVSPAVVAAQKIKIERSGKQLRIVTKCD